MQLGRLQGILQQSGDGHGSDPAGDRRDPTGALAGTGEIHIAHQLAPVVSVHAYIDYNGPLFYPVAGNVFGAADVVQPGVFRADGVVAAVDCQVGAGEHVEMRCIVDSHVVGVAKPDPAIFDHALVYFAEFDRSRIAYVGDSVTMDIGAATAAGLHPILLDPYDDHAGADFERIGSVHDLATELP